MALRTVQPSEPIVLGKTAVSVLLEKEVMTGRSTSQTPRYLVASPYTDPEHLLDLQSLDIENQVLSEALQGMRAVTEEYATSPYVESFNWDEVIDRVRELASARKLHFKETSWYIVAFRSQIKPTTVLPDLGALDKAAHAEAMASGGFLKYWFGTPNHELRNLATCIWRSQDDAKKGSVGPEHRKAAMAARSSYAEWRIDQHRLVIRDAVSSWEILNC
ncbi:unnamed protein product [Discula destructiva]